MGGGQSNLSKDATRVELKPNRVIAVVRELEKQLSPSLVSLRDYHCRRLPWSEGTAMMVDCTCM